MAAKIVYKLGREVLAIHRYHFDPIGGILLVVSLEREALILIETYEYCVMVVVLLAIKLALWSWVIRWRWFLTGSNDRLHGLSSRQSLLERSP
jgi:hypothetical protein